MINVVYLVLVIHSVYGNSESMTNIAIPQANIAQCEVNRKNYKNTYNVKASYCIVGVMSK